MGLWVVLKATAGDMLMTFLWVFSVSTLAPLASIVSSTIVPLRIPNLVIITSLLFLYLLIFSTVAAALGGASFNPTATAAFHAAGLSKSKNSLVSLAVRFPAQAVGAMGGAVAILELMPYPYSRMLKGPSLKVDVHTGAVAEGVLTFVITLVVLLIVTRGPRNPIVKTWMLAISTVSLVISGSGYTGPSMNPANAFAWAYVNKRHDSWEHVYVYWICPFAGAILAAWVFRLLFAPAAVKIKKA